MAERLGRTSATRRWTVVLALATTALAAWGLAASTDGALLGGALSTMAAEPLLVALALAAFGVAFLLRALVWARVLPGLGVGHALGGLHVSLGANHVLPLRLGEPLRVVSVVRRAGVPPDTATASTVALRAGDIVAVAVIAAVVGPAVVGDLLGGWGFAVVGAVLGVGVLAGAWTVRLRRRGAGIRLPGPLVLAGTAAAWLCEAVLVWICAGFAGLDISFADAVVVTTVAVAAQTVAIAPSGLGTYEAASVGAYAALGYDPGVALVAALTAHGLKTLYSLVGGGIALLLPAPGFFGRLRLPRRASATDLPTTQPDDPDAPVVLFLPAHDEEESVAEVVRRAPAAVAGHPVQVVVVDDGSTDRTAARAAAAGAEVVLHDTNRGLGAAVRTGLADAVARGAVAAAFCDADGEYAPEELESLVAPVLAGDADYVVGSRFAGTIHHMRLHRRVGNLVLTRALAFVARTPVSDGQSGYRVLSRTAAADAVVAHDFNYAQVLTLDLLAKGYRYAEVPISYHFRTTGRSFVRLGRYLRHVVPTVYRVVNDAAAPATVGGAPALQSSTT